MPEMPHKPRILRERRVLVAWVALAYTALFMPSILAVQPAGANPVTLITMLAGAFVYSWAFFFTIRCSRRLFAILAPLMFFMSAAASYFIWQYKFEMTYQQLGVITEVETRTALAFISVRLVLWILATTAIGIWLTRRAIRLEEPDPKDARLLFITGILMLCIFTTEVGTITQRYFPYNLLFAVKDFAGEKVSLMRGTTTKADVTYDAKQPVTIILVIGESVRAAKLGPKRLCPPDHAADGQALGRDELSRREIVLSFNTGRGAVHPHQWFLRHQRGRPVFPPATLPADGLFHRQYRYAWHERIRLRFTGEQTFQRGQPSHLLQRQHAERQQRR